MTQLTLSMSEPMYSRKVIQKPPVNPRPILFTGPMVLANLKSIKTQTRRIITDCRTTNASDSEFVGLTDFDTLAHFRKKGGLTFFAGYKVKHGVGDLLYVRENLIYNSSNDCWNYKADNTPVLVDSADELEMVAWAHHKESEHCNSIHMPKILSRLWLKVSGVRVERLHDIREADALAEGIEIFKKTRDYLIPINHGHFREPNPVRAYLALFNQINGTTMQDNPFVWVIDYKLIDRPQYAPAPAPGKPA